MRIPTAFLLLAAASIAPAGELFITSAVEHSDHTVTLPLHRGTSRGRTVYYVILDTSDGDLSQALGVNRSQKLNHARGTAAVQKIELVDGVVDFPASVDFSPMRSISAPHGFPPEAFQPGAIGEPGYSPLIELPDGIVVNAPHIAMDTGGGNIQTADKVRALDLAHWTVTYNETDGFQGGKAVRYVSTDASDLLAAALEGVTYAPALNNAPAFDDDSTHSSLTSLAAFVNGQIGRSNPQRQGLNSAVEGDGDPLNVLRWNPSQGRYSPLWDVHLAAWSAQRIASRTNLRQRDWGDIQGLADRGELTLADAGFIVNCPIISSE